MKTWGCFSNWEISFKISEEDWFTTEVISFWWSSEYQARLDYKQSFHVSKQLFSLCLQVFGQTPFFSANLFLSIVKNLATSWHVYSNIGSCSYGHCNVSPMKEDKPAHLTSAQCDQPSKPKKNINQFRERIMEYI